MSSSVGNECVLLCCQVRVVCPLCWLLSAVETLQAPSTQQEIQCSFISPQTASLVDEALMLPTPKVFQQEQTPAHSQTKQLASVKSRNPLALALCLGVVVVKLGSSDSGEKPANIPFCLRGVAVVTHVCFDLCQLILVSFHSQLHQ